MGKIKNAVSDCLYRVYLPFIIRKEKMKAATWWRDGVKQCEKMYKELGAPRVYLFFDTQHMVFAPMTYEPNKQLRPALKQLRTMGKLRGAAKVKNVEDAKEMSFYYTPSKWGAKGCREHNAIREEKLRKWMFFYLTRLSKPVMKMIAYQKKNPHLPSPIG